MAIDPQDEKAYEWPKIRDDEDRIGDWIKNYQQTKKFNDSREKDKQ